MTTLEKAINLLHTMPETNVEIIYAFMQSIQSKPTASVPAPAAFGIAHKYANPELIAKEKGAFEHEITKKHELN